MNKKRNEILSNPNVLSKYEYKGTNEQEYINVQVPPINLTFTKGRFYIPSALKTTLTDKNSSNRLEILTKLNIK